MHIMCDLLLDKANSPWFNPSEKDKFLNLAHAEFVETRYRQFELDERTRKELLPLVRIFTSSSNVSLVNLSGIVGYMFTLNLIAEFNKKCGTGTFKIKVTPLQLDDEAENELDPFNRSEDDNPTYVEYNNGTNNIAEVKSTNVPLLLFLKYLKMPVKVLLDVTNPANNVNSEMPEFTHEEIVNIAVRKMMATTEQQLNYQLQNNEINNQN